MIRQHPFHLKVWKWVEDSKSPSLPIINFTWNNLTNVSYPEGNLEGNQLLGLSISLSPLYPSYTNDLHVSIDLSFHKDFSQLHSKQA